MRDLGHVGVVVIHEVHDAVQAPILDVVECAVAVDHPTVDLCRLCLHRIMKTVHQGACWAAPMSA